MSISCIVLAGGLGTRLRSAVPILPKCLAPVSGRPFIEWQMRSLAERGIKHFVLALCYGADEVLAALKQPWARSIAIDTVIERDLLGTGGAVNFAFDEIGFDDSLVVNGDTLIGGSLHMMFEALDVSQGETMRMATVRVSDRSRFGGVAVDASQSVRGFYEKGQTGSGLINAGLYRIHRKAFDYQEPGVFSLERELMPRLIAQGALQARELAGPFIDIGVPEDYNLLVRNPQSYV